MGGVAEADGQDRGECAEEEYEEGWEEGEELDVCDISQSRAGSGQSKHASLWSRRQGVWLCHAVYINTIPTIPRREPTTRDVPATRPSAYKRSTFSCHHSQADFAYIAPIPSRLFLSSGRRLLAKVEKRRIHVGVIEHLAREGDGVVRRSSGGVVSHGSSRCCPPVVDGGGRRRPDLGDGGDGVRHLGRIKSCLDEDRIGFTEDCGAVVFGRRVARCC